ncbi:alpha-N-acetylglucosaminidase C-terminal domain-containing protein [Streptomyces actinomycinicus]|uniref:Alpha-N-acetylglucosaminidase C-terminal domain-containing protein n=1 Tax=Streptomyces actinomycinicus TaxID=1695166 RepID=A0A937EK85_9ACTN|nr:alpha-N-acetylglucosaminidase TIM-barrel domain-containing protein [Streptomyces actinomycinicus]MBL1083599.1 alpha-N-acetylglucosaminidase C-terminal domain-containing protein [Streptomyces actinomycinicus]
MHRFRARRRVVLWGVALAAMAGLVAPAAAELAAPPQAPTGPAGFDAKPAVAALKRLLRGHESQADQFTLVPVARPQTGDTFSVSGTAGAIKVEGSSPATLLTGIGWYLKHVAKVDIGWPGDSLAKLPATLPAVDGTITQSAAVPHRYALNDTDDGYSGAYRDFNSYQRMIDLLALHGVNEVYVQAGAEYPYYKALQQFGYSADDLQKWIPSPAHQPWWLLQNMSGGGPVSEQLIEARATLGKEIADRIRELGMTPVLPGYFGTVPSDFANRNPGANVVAQGSWVGYARPSWLDPTDPRFAEVAAAYYKHQRERFGDTTMYKMDPLHEGGMAGDINVKAAARAVMNALQNAHPSATWVLIGWLNNPRTDMTNAVDKSKLLIVDGLSDRYTSAETLDRDKTWEGAPYAFGIIDNFGGHTSTGGNTGEWLNRFARLRKSSPALKGIAYLPEGTGTNPAGFELFTELGWRPGTVDQKAWFAEYSARRYGGQDPHAEAAWDLLRQGPYSTKAGQWSEPQDSLFAARPDLAVKTAATWSPQEMRYDASTVEKALAELLQVAPDKRATDAYTFDLVDIARQALVNRSRVLLPLIKAAHDSKNTTRFTALVAEWQKDEQLLDKLLATDSRFLLGPWLEAAKSWAKTDSEKARLEYDARSIITTWGDTAARSAQVHDYANREWSGLVSDFYAMRWQKYFESLAAGSPKPLDWFAIEDAWAHEHETYPTTPTGDPVAMAIQVDKTLSSAAADTTVPADRAVPADPIGPDPAGPIQGSGKCAGTAGGKISSGTPLQWRPCNGTAAHSWTVTTGTQTTAAQLSIEGSGTCMDVKGGAVAPGTTVQLYTCNDTPAQRWTVQQDKTLKNVKAGLCLTAPSAGSAAGAPLTIETCTGRAGQQWTLPSPSSSPSSGASPGGSAPGGTGGPTGGGGTCTAAPWDHDTEYHLADVVSHNGSSWKAKWWTRGNEPGGTTAWGAWERVSTC